LNPPGIYRFRDFRIDLARRELRRGGELLAPSVKVFDCIAYLIEHRERAVGRDELIAAVWGRAEVTYAMLGQLVIKVRRILGGCGDDQDLIRTLPRFGYRWVADVVAGDTMATGSGAADALPPSGSVLLSRLRHFTRPRWALPVLLVPVLAAAILFAVQHAGRFRAGAPSVQTADALAVLPVDVEADGSWSWVRLGVMDLIAERLRGAGLPVVPSENVVALARDPSRAREAVSGATGVKRIVSARASLEDAGWSVHLVLTSVQGVDKVVDARAAEVTAAAQMAADRMLAALGKPVPVSGVPPGQSLLTLLARAKSAMLSNELDKARRILESAPPDLRQSPDLRRWLAKADDRAGHLEAAKDRLETLLGEVGAESNPRLRAAVLNDLGVVALHANRPDLAEGRFDEALSLLLGQQDVNELGRTYLGRGITYALKGQYDRASAEFGRARVAYGVSGDTISLAIVEVDEAELEIRANRHAAARSLLEDAATSFERFNARHELFEAEALRMRVGLALLEAPQAYAIGARRVAQLDQLESPLIRQNFLLQWAEVLMATGRLKEARDTFDLLKRETDSAGDPFGHSLRIDSRLALLDLEEGRFEAALSESTRAVHGLGGPDDEPSRAVAWLAVIRSSSALGREAEASRESERFTAWAMSRDVVVAHVYARLAEAERADREGRRDMARQAWEAALGEAARSGVPRYIAEVADSYGSRLLDWHDLDHAATVIGSVARYAAADFRSAMLIFRLAYALGREKEWRAALQQLQVLAGERPVPRETMTPASASPRA